ncbi:MAG: chromosome segregation protein SMC, partial [Xanthomonadaceae bacterium]|nr:chromosome segregation protein SMC [Xanthomonadaceae bacterium]
MRLSTIKLSGFKSFVDPTVLHLPGNMTGVVGPNGCGKSNIIDAVRWVMGESSASRLRGDNLTDVIFAGSSSRKPVSQALVELVFDNADGQVGGEYAGYGEISVKRTVSRDGQSSYFLNGTRCRRRDITDLFLGTGLGPRSYSIIEQGMISQVIDAKPEELRVYLEEAAGISKYKERRRETETRIRHTRENLERLTDVRNEVEKQIDHLKRQARAAEQYQTLKADHREKDAQLKALEYRRLQGELGALREQIGSEETALEGLIAEQRQAEAQIELCREQHAEARENLNKIQADAYHVGGEIARIEQQIQHQRELRQRLQQARGEADQARAQLHAHIDGDTQQLAEAQTQISAAAPRLSDLQASDAQRQQALREVEAALAQWQQQWDAYARAQSEAARAAEVERTRIEYLDRQTLEAERRRETLAAERKGLDVEALTQTLATVTAEHEQQRTSVETLGAQLEQRKQAQTALLERQRNAQAELAELRKQQQAARGRLASLEALQHAALGQEKSAALAWLQAQGLADAHRLGELLTVEAGWETAVESVLGVLLEAVLVDSTETYVDAIAMLDGGRVALVSQAVGNETFAADSLAAKVSGPAAIRRLLAGIRLADDLAAARALVPTLAAGTAVITRGGEWMSAGWLRVARSGEAQQGALARERDIQSLRAELVQLGERETQLGDELTQLRQHLTDAEQQREDAQRSVYLAHRSVSELAGQMQSQGGRLQSAQQRIAHIDSELAQLANTAAEAQAQASAARGTLETALTRMAELETDRQRLDGERRTLSEQRDAARNTAREASEATHALALSVQAQRAQAASLEQSLLRMQQQREQLQARCDELAMQLADGDAPIHALDAARQAGLEQLIAVDKQLAQARSAVDGVEGELRRCEQVRQQRDQQALSRRDAIARLRLQEQSLALHAQQLADAVASAEQVMEEVMAA